MARKTVWLMVAMKNYDQSKWGRDLDSKRLAADAKKRIWDEESTSMLPDEDKLLKEGEVITEVHVRVTDSTHQSNLIVMAWYTQISLWLLDRHKVKLVVHIPGRKKSVRQLFEASFRPIPNVETSLFW